MTSNDPFETLDPENWDEMRALAHRMVDDAMTYLETVRERPVWQQVPYDIAETFNQPAPHEPLGAEAAYQEFTETIMPYPMGNIHPRFWAGTSAEIALGGKAGRKRSGIARLYPASSGVSQAPCRKRWAR